MERKRRRYTAAFLILLPLAGVVNVIDRVSEPYLSTALTIVNLGMYIGLLFWWLTTVRARLLPTRERAYIVASGVLLVVLLLLRMVRYRIIPDEAIRAARYCWYGYYVPILFVPALFLMCCVRIAGQGKQAGGLDLWLLVPPTLLSIGFLTNEAHFLAFRPKEWADATNWGYATDYVHGPLFFAAYGWIGACIVTGVALLVLTYARAGSRKKALYPLSILALWVALLELNNLFSAQGWYRLYNFPEIHAFCMVGVYESCIRTRLMSCNENYAGFFRRMQTPAVITDRAFSPVYRTARPQSSACRSGRRSSLPPPPPNPAGSKRRGQSASRASGSRSIPKRRCSKSWTASPRAKPSTPTRRRTCRSGA